MSLALQRADRENIPSYHLSARKFGSEETLAKEILDVLSKYKIHHAVIQAHESETGITIHRVNAEYDSGEIVAQTKVPVRADDTAEILADRVLEREHEFLIEVISHIANGKIALGNL